MTPLVRSLRAAGDPLRMRILLLLLDREACVCELMAVFGLPQSKLSHHLIALRNAGLLQDEKRGRWNYYRIRPEGLDPDNYELVRFIAKRLGNGVSALRDKRALGRACRPNSSCC